MGPFTLRPDDYVSVRFEILEHLGTLFGQLLIVSICFGNVRKPLNSFNDVVCGKRA